ncbi:MAG: hypothetical protein JXA97_10425 [Anaerolineales bacterium]|nr:hypothetical protein [Anaerolineales bacterium]
MTEEKTHAGDSREDARSQIRKIQEGKERREGMKALEGKTNQDMINILYKAAKELNMAEWDLIKKVELTKLTDDRAAAYAGPAVVDFPGISAEQKDVIEKVLEAYVPKEK